MARIETGGVRVIAVVLGDEQEGDGEGWGEDVG